jgi:surfactin synthase thioesterase subunit
MLSLMLPAIRADYTAIETYRSAEDTQVACPVTVLTGDDDPRTSLDDARAWERHTTGQFDLRVFPGGHFYLAEQWPQVTEVIMKGLAG